MTFKIMYHVGESIDLKTKVKSGNALLTDNSFEIRGPLPLSIEFSSIKSVEMFRLHNLGRMIKIDFSSGILFLSVVRFNFFGYFAVINFLKTGALFEILKSAAERTAAVDPAKRAG